MHFQPLNFTGTLKGLDLQGSVAITGVNWPLGLRLGAKKVKYFPHKDKLAKTSSTIEKDFKDESE